MARVLQLRRGSATDHSSFTGAVGEITYDTTDKRIVVHDGTTVGGIPLSKESESSSAADTSTPGLVELATDAEAQAKTDTARAMTPSNLAAIGSSTIFAGLVELATDAETRTGTDTARAVTPSNLSARTAFAAHKNGSTQSSITGSGGYTKVTFGTETFDRGSAFASSTWTPPSGQYAINACLYFTTTNATANELLGLSVYKNGSEHMASYINRNGTNSCSVTLACLVSANGTDTFEVYAYKSGAGAGSLNGTEGYTFFHGHVI